ARAPDRRPGATGHHGGHGLRGPERERAAGRRGARRHRGAGASRRRVGDHGCQRRVPLFPSDGRAGRVGRELVAVRPRGEPREPAAARRTARGDRRYAHGAGGGAPRAHRPAGRAGTAGRSARRRRGGGARGSRPHHPALSATDPLLAAAARGPGPLMNTSRGPSLAAAVLTAAFLTAGCRAPTACAAPVPPVLLGSWTYSATQTNPSATL